MFILKIVNVLQNYKIIKHLIVYTRNRIFLDDNIFKVGDIRFSKNSIKLLGAQQSILCYEQSFFRDCNISMKGIGNSVEVNDYTQVYGENKQVIYVDGNNNRIMIGKNCRIRNTSFFIWGNDNTIVVEDNVTAYGAEFHIEQNKNCLRIGKGSTFHGREGYPIHIALDEGSNILIKEDYMFPNGIQIRSTDSHSIVDLNGKRINPARNIVIGKHTWIGLGCIILKGTNIADHTVVAAGSICTKQYSESNCILAGNPAKVVKYEIDWSRDLI